MGSIRKIGNSYTIRFDLPGSTRTTRKQKQIAGFKTSTDAKRALTDIEYKINHGAYIEDTELKVVDFFETWFCDHVKHLAPKTQLYYKGLYDNYIKPYFDGFKLNALKANHINSFYTYLRNNETSDDIIFKCHKTLKACLNKAYQWDYTDYTVMDKITPPKEPKPQLTYWDPSTIKFALEILKNSSVYFHIFISLHLGLRLGEVCALKLDDIDFKKATLRVDETLQYVNGETITKATKTESSTRNIPLTNDLLNFFKDHSYQIKENQDFFGQQYNPQYVNFFSVFEDGSIKNDCYVTKRFLKDIRKTDLPIIRFHDLRHSCASWLLYNGIDLKTIQEILGHASFDTTANTYAHVANIKKRNALESLSF